MNTGSNTTNDSNVGVVNNNLDFSKFPWYRKDKLGWPIETFKNKPVKNFIRIVCQNIRKITG